MSGALHPNLQVWQGWRTLIRDPNRVHGHHAKSHHRGPIEGTSAETIARIRRWDKNPDSYLTVGERVLEVYYSCLQFEEPEDQWYFTRVLGCGSFGLACLYQKTDGSSITDEVVAKSELPTASGAVHTDVPEIPKEVFHLAQVNDRRNQAGNERLGATQLRGFKYIQGDYSTRRDGGSAFLPDPAMNHVNGPLYQEWRTFMENCDYGTLSRIMYTYKAWGYHVPEAFVWWTFLWVMEACKAMDQDPSQEFHAVSGRGSTFPVRGSFMLSNDIKHDNIFIGGPWPLFDIGAPFDKYPAARMGDFGLSRVGRIHRNNRPGAFPKGTRLWMAPEKRPVGMGQDRRGHRTYPFWHQDRVDRGTWNANGGHPLVTDDHCIGPEANVWSAAVAMYLLMTLWDIIDVDDIVKRKTSTDNMTRDDNDEGLYLFEIDDFPTQLSGDEDYSDELKNLVRECTRIEPMERPGIDQILDEIHAGIERERSRLQVEFGDDEAINFATRMAFTNEQWLGVPEGPFDITPRSTPGVHGGGSDRINMEWRDFHDMVEEWADPNAPTLVPPRQWRIREGGDPGPQYYTAQNPKPAEEFAVPAPVPFYGSDWILYVDEAFIAPYHGGPALPRGGRAWAWQMMDEDAINRLMGDEDMTDGH